MDAIKSLYKARQTAIKMLTKRGYTGCGTESISTETLSQFKSNYVFSGHADRDLLTLIANKGTNSVIVLFVDDNHLKITDCENKVNSIWEVNRDFYATSAENFKLHWILVCQSAITQKMKHQVVDWMVNVKGLKIELFSEQELLFDITEHVDIPRHQRLHRAQIMEIIKDLKLGDDISAIHRLPKLKKDDMVSRFYDFEKGDVIEIKKHSPIMSEALFYRVVI